MTQLLKKVCENCHGMGKVMGIGRMAHQCTECFGVGYFDPNVEKYVKEREEKVRRENIPRRAAVDGFEDFGKNIRKDDVAVEAKLKSVKSSKRGRPSKKINDKS